MPSFSMDIEVVFQLLDNECFLARGLFFPEVTRFGDRRPSLGEGVVKSAEIIVGDLTPLEVHRRSLPGQVETGSVEVTVTPRLRSAAMTRPITMTFPFVRWTQGEEMELAYLPTLDLQINAKDRDELQERMPKEIRAALFRMKALDSLEQLCALQRCTEVIAETKTASVSVKSPKKREMDALEPPKKSSVLAKVGDRLSGSAQDRAFEIDDVVERLADALGEPRSTSVLLVGPSGVGKTAALLEMVRRRRDFRFEGRRFWATSGSRLIAGMTGFGMWQERCEALARECAEGDVILHLGNLIELMEVGKSEHNAQGIASFLRPFIQRGSLVVVVECTDEQVKLIEQREPHILGVFHQIELETPDRDRGRSILRRSADLWRLRFEVTVSDDAIDVLDQLMRRYSPYSANPGRPLGFLKRLVQDAERGSSIDAAEIVQAFLDESGLPRFMVDDEVPLDLEETSRWFRDRVLGQPEAIDLLIDLLASVKAGLSRPRKPLGSLLLIGPTGVGKTELAKVLARFLFGSEERLTRFDMSEYADPISLGRLTGSIGAGEGLLTSKVREQPFSVVLFDEVEKAHPLFFDLLLQVLGEGRLTDASGRMADFSSAVVLMTSNLGAEAFQRQPVGFERDDAGQEAMQGVMTTVRDFFRPELLGRIDRVVPFGQLDRANLERIAARQLEAIARRDGVALRGLEVDWDGDVASYLAQRGFDPRYGARPLRRTIERELLAPLATKLNRKKSQIPLSAKVSAPMAGEERSLAVSLAPRGRAVGGEQATEVGSFDGKLDFDRASVVSDFRRIVQGFRRGAAFRDLNNDIFRLERLRERVERRKARGRPIPEYLLADLGRLKAFRSVWKLLESIWDDLCHLEDLCLLRIYRPDESPPPVLPVPRQLKNLEIRWSAALLDLYCLRFPHSSRITLGVYAEDAEALAQLTGAYRMVIQKVGLEADEWRWAMGINPKTGQQEVQGKRIADPRMGWPHREPTEGALGLSFEIRGKAAYPRFVGEAGLHEMLFERAKEECLVHCSEVVGRAYHAPAGIERRQALKGHPHRRLYRMVEKKIIDRKIGMNASFRGKKLGDALTTIIETNLSAEVARSLLGS